MRFDLVTSCGISVVELAARCFIMSSIKEPENWLLVEWNSGGRNVVFVRSVLKPANKELKIGDEMTVSRRGIPTAAKLIARARERDVLDAILRNEDAPPGPSSKNEEEPADFSSGASSWVPSDDGEQSGDSDEVESKKIKLERCKRHYTNRRSSKKIMTPSNKATPVIPKIMEKANQLKRKREKDALIRNLSNNNISINSSRPDSIKRTSNTQNGANQKVIVDLGEIFDIKNKFKELLKLIEELKEPNKQENNTSGDVENMSASNLQDDTHQSFDQSDDDKENEIMEDFDRSDDNILITNKYSNANVKTVKQKDHGYQEWIPIGSGKTLIHADQYKKVNWKSYTIATRTLLLAVFPRKVLATHSLTGKRSPAFQDKPAKMCLDPKIISDVIMEIMDRFKVRENLVRSIITTKCADECKMWKSRVNKKKQMKAHKYGNKTRK